MTTTKRQPHLETEDNHGTTISPGNTGHLRNDYRVTTTTPENRGQLCMELVHHMETEHNHGTTTSPGNRGQICMERIHHMEIEHNHGTTTSPGDMTTTEQLYFRGYLQTEHNHGITTSPEDMKTTEQLYFRVTCRQRTTTAQLPHLEKTIHGINTCTLPGDIGQSRNHNLT
ncbi:unnamed protein product [Mytilus edulis]|uniref:Uncharacterized protein n=1 Tax=Mytilus edulis TaxID=6550 RepID=A0A8S3T7D3_MYTED|nr:unnamed protein product [Mytilus edulis]